MASGETGNSFRDSEGTRTLENTHERPQSDSKLRLRRARVKTHFSSYHVIQQEDDHNGDEGVGVASSQNVGTGDPVVNFKLDLDDDMVSLAWRSTEVCTKKEICDI